MVLTFLNLIKRTLSGLRQLLAAESLLKIVKIFFCFTLNSFFYKSQKDWTVGLLLLKISESF